MRTIVFVVLQVLIVATACARRVAGTVYEDNKRTPIEAALVRCYDGEKRLQAYAYSDEKGHFEINVAETAVSMQVSCLGFSSRTILKADWSEKMSIVMSSSEFQIKEVKVTSKRIEERADTLVYSVAGFSQPQDRSIADVMAKMPGIEIKPNGQIEYNGAAINKFYIEGMDLMDNKYALASNNLNRKHVKSVEILRNHQPIAVMRGKTFSEQAAVNLILEDNAKWHLTGTADIGAGVDNDGEFRHENRLLAMLFKSRTQNLSIYKGNNVGKDISSEVLGVSLRDKTFQTEKEHSWLNSMESYASNLSPERTTFNESHLVATNHLNRIGHDATFRTQLSYFYHDYHNSLQRYTDYNLSDGGTAVFDEEYQSKQIQHHADANLCYELNNKKIYLKDQAVASLQWIDGRNDMVSNGMAKRVGDCLDQHYLANNLQLTLPVSEKRMMEVVSSLSYNKIPQHLSTLTDLVQQVDYHSFNTYHHLAMTNKLLGFYLKNQLGMETSNQSAELYVVGTEARPTSEMKKIVPSWQSTLNVKRENLRWEASLLLKYWNIRSSVGDKSAFLPEWNTMLRYDATAKSNYTLRYAHSQSFYDMQRICETPYYMGYRTLTESHLTLDNTPTESVTLRYEFSNPIKGFFASALLQGSSMVRKSILQSRVEDGNIYLRSYVNTHFHRKSLTAYTRLSQSLGLWKSLIALSGNYIYTNDRRLRNEALVPVNQNTIIAQLSYSMKPTRRLSVELAEDMSFNYVACQGTTVDSRQWSTEANIYYKFTERLSVAWENSYFRYANLGQQVLFSDLSATYNFGRFELGLSARNIGNKHAYEQKLVATDYQVINQYKLRPREYMLRLSFSY
jgi:hypothetical protein